jgi:hypothetical protein
MYFDWRLVLRQRAARVAVATTPTVRTTRAMMVSKRVNP